MAGLPEPVHFVPKIKPSLCPNMHFPFLKIFLFAPSIFFNWSNTWSFASLETHWKVSNGCFVVWPSHIHCTARLSLNWKFFMYTKKSTKIQEPFTNSYTLLTCGNGGIFSLLDLPNSLAEYNKRLGSKPEKLFQTWFALLVQILNIIFLANLKISICEEYYDRSMLS